MLQREYLINKAPAKELIPILIKDPSLELLRSFFRTRVEWRSYPIFHERMLSSSLFDDYVPLLEQNPEVISTTLDYALKLASEEDEKYILCSVFLISALCYTMPKEISPSATQIEMIEQLHKRVKPLSFIMNLSSFWEAIANYAGRSNPELEEELNFADTEFPDLPQYQFTAESSARKCPVSSEQLDDWLLAYSNLYHAEFRREMKVVDDYYWVFKCYKINLEGQKEYSRDHLFIQDTQGGSVRMFNIKISIEDDELLRQEIIKCHYSPWTCENQRH